MFWMCNDETVINLDQVRFFAKEPTDDVPESKPRICFYWKNGSIVDIYNSEEERDHAYDTLIKSLDIII